MKFFKKTKKTTELIDTENRLLVARGEGEEQNEWNITRQLTGPSYWFKQGNEVKSIMLTEISQKQKTTYLIIPHEILKKTKLYWMPRGRVEKMDCKGAWRNFLGNGKVLHHDCGAGYTTVYTCQNSPNPTYIKLEKFTVYKLYLNKPDSKNPPDFREMRRWEWGHTLRTCP